MNRSPPVRSLDLRRPPTFFRDHAMHVEIFGPRAEVEPFTLFENNAANLSALRDPLSENRNEGDLLLRRNAREDGRAPHCDVSKIVFARNAVAIGNIDHPIFAKRDGRTQTGLAKRESNIVTSIEMVIDQGLQTNVRQNITAISDERLAA